MEELLALIESGDITKAYESFTAKKGVPDYAREYNNERDIRDTQVGKRKDKVVKNEVIPVTKIAIPFQRKIVKSAASFLFGSPVKLVSKDETDDISKVSQIWGKLRMNQLLLDFCKTSKSETEASLVFFHVKKEGEDPYLKARVLSNDNGKVFPVIDAYGDMVAFGWEYTAREGEKDVKYLYVWTKDKVILSKGDGSKWEPVEGYPQENPFGKIPVVYLSQDKPEWWEVVQLIDRFEMRFSKWADTNDYFGAPMYKAKGGVKSFPKKDDTGKIIKLDVIETDKGNIIEADLDVLSWDHAPESTKMELDTNKGLIYGMTDTPDLTYDSVKGLGSISGVALELLFFGSIIKAKWDMGDYVTVVSRAINIMKAGMNNILKGENTVSEELEVDIQFTSILPQNLKETIEILTEASGGKQVMSQKTAMKNNPLVDDIKQEEDNLTEESKRESEVLGGTLNV